MDYLVSVFGDDRVFFSDLFKTYDEDNSIRIEKLKSLMNTNDAAAIEDLAHSIKGASGNVGAERLRELATDLETMGRERELSQAPSIIELMVSEFEKVKAFINDYQNA
jgi:HPt (histidine-containing phosphotransfer) domain-containing protein